MFCTQCGQKAPEDAKFCGSCGANVLAEATTAASSITGLRSENLPPERQEFLGRAEAGDEDAMFELAGWCKSVGNLDTAIFWYQKLVELGDPFAAFELGRIFEEEDDDDQAEKLFLLSAKATETTYAAEKLGQHYARRGKNIEARQWLLTAIEWLDKPDEDDYTEEDGANIHLELAKVLAKLDENAEAEMWFQKAVDAGNLEAMASFGIFLESQGEDERAHTWLKKSADAGHIPGLFFLGWFHEDAGRLDEAKKCFTKAAEADDDDAAYRLGLLYRAEGNHAEAERWLRKAADAGNDEAKAALESTPRTGVVIKTHGYRFSDEQINELKEYAEELSLIVTKYGISATSISEKEAEELAQAEPNRLFSLTSDHQSGLEPGFVSGSLGYYPSRIPFSAPPSPYPYTEVSVHCVVCDGEGLVGEDEEQCSNCEDGTHLFDLEWDADGVVTAINVLPPR